MCIYIYKEDTQEYMYMNGFESVYVSVCVQKRIIYKRRP